MTDNQKLVLSWMYERNLGAILFEGSYRFPVHFRNDSGLADRYAGKIAKAQLVNR
jgi:hypothetical protein